MSKPISPEISARMLSTLYFLGQVLMCELQLLFRTLPLLLYEVRQTDTGFKAKGTKLQY